MAGQLALPSASEAHTNTRDAIATFIAKVWNIVEKPEYSTYIHWSDSGKTFIVCDYSNFAHDILPQYFKHSNFSSFVRQLNLYGFRKVNRPEQGTLAKPNADESLEFWHTNFRRGHPELLCSVQRKVGPQAQKSERKQPLKHCEDHHEMQPQITKVLGDIHQMQGRQENIVLVLDALKDDNSHLRCELSMLREKTVRQQKVLNKIIQFLVHMVYKGKLPRRNVNSRLMLMDAASMDGPPSPKRMRPMVSDELDNIPVVDFSDFLFPSDEQESITEPQFMTSDTPTSVQSPESHLSSVQSQFDQLSSVTPVSPSLSYTKPTQSPVKSTSDTRDINSATLSPSTGFTFSSDTIATGNPSFSLTDTKTSDPVLSVQPTPTFTSTSTGLDIVPTGLEIVPVQSSSGSNVSFSLFPIDSGVNTGETGDLLQLPFISSELLKEYPIHPAPQSLVAQPHPENRLCINGQLDHQQSGIDAIPDMLSGHLSLDPEFITEFMNSEDGPVPDYDFVDTARLLETLTNMNQDTVTDENTVYQQLNNPGSGGQTRLPLTHPTSSASETTSQLHRLLEGNVK